MKLLRSLAVTGIVSIGVAIGCSSSDPEGGTTAKACTLPASAPAQDDFCQALAAYDGRCGHCEDCTGKNLQHCAKRGAAISAAHRAACIACPGKMPCDPAFASLLGCVPEQLAKATPTAAQRQAKDAYCTACNATDTPACLDFFAANQADGKNGTGYSLLLASDATATKAITTCSSKCDPTEYGVCVALLLCTDEGGDFCVDGGFCAAQP